jgi:hypothetical protein
VVVWWISVLQKNDAFYFSSIAFSVCVWADLLVIIFLQKWLRYDLISTTFWIVRVMRSELPVRGQGWGGSHFPAVTLFQFYTFAWSQKIEENMTCTFKFSNIWIFVHFDHPTLVSIWFRSPNHKMIFSTNRLFKPFILYNRVVLVNDFADVNAT